MKITNISLDVQRLTAKDGTVHEIDPGDTVNVDIDRDNVNVEAKLNARLIAFEERGSGSRSRPAAADASVS